MKRHTRTVAPQHWTVHAGGAGVALLVAALFHQGIYAPLRREASDRGQRIELIRTLSTSGDQIAADHRRLVERLDALNKAVGRTLRRMPTTASAQEFVEQATELAGAYGLEVRQTQTGMPQHHASHSTIDVSYLLTGSYASICRYLAAIDQVSQLTRTARLDVERSTDSGGYPLQVTFQLYYRTDPNDINQQRGAL